MTAPSRGALTIPPAFRGVGIFPALLVAITALSALPGSAGGYRLVKWGVFGVALAVLALAVLIERPRLPAVRHWLPVGGFVGAAVFMPALSSALSPAHVPGALGLMCGLALWLTTFLALQGDDASRRAGISVLIWASVPIAGLVLLQAAGLRFMTSEVYTGAEFRAPGTLGNPNWAAAFLAPLAPLALSLAATRGRQTVNRLSSSNKQLERCEGEQRRAEDPGNRALAPHGADFSGPSGGKLIGALERPWPHYLVAALLAFATLATLSKGGALTLAAGLVVYVVINRQVQRRLRIALLAGVAASAVGALTFAWQQGLFVSASWLRGRLFLWQNALFLANERPLTGVGLGGYVPAYGRSSAALIDGDPSVFMPLSSIDFAHNDVLQYAAEGGFVTVAAFLLVGATALRTAHRLGGPLARGVGAALAAIFVGGLADSPMRVPSTFVLFFFLLGWLSAASRAKQAPSHEGEDTKKVRTTKEAALGAQRAPRVKQSAPKERRISQVRSTNEARSVTRTAGSRHSGHTAEIVLVAIALLGLVQGIRFLAGNAAWTQGRDALIAGRPAVAHLERARLYLPEHGRSASQLARALTREGKPADALEMLAVASTLRFDFDDELLRCDLQVRSLDPDAAIDRWQALAGRYPALVTPRLRLGMLHLQAGDRDAATAAFRAVLESPQQSERADAARHQARGFLQTLER
ncbi:MAG: O-antigen ligase family protein [Polyangiaceae bacterium]|nr:O-antigen ligase family protein [Polyangiaceae bacterium]MCW5791260.1 O-antigen ligase family protein [Polyangiaceae bacterium]